MDVIQLLPDSVANQIAAGEVIQRPASVIKELMENAIDAGAKHIQVLVNDAGKSSIQVIDDGCGMSDTDARLSFERHATSKIRQATDLFSLHTMGFRGEALASIAAVAQVTLQTRRQEDEVGTRLRIDGSQLVEQEMVSCPVGSNFLVENLFFNIPARRKFLKSNATEMSNITQAFERIVLIYPETNFSLYNNGQEVLSLRSASFRQRIIDIFGKRLNQQLLPVEADTSVCKISGFVGKPESARKKGSHQYFFVNGRYMKHPYFHKAVLTAYDRLLPDGEQVSYFLNFTVNPEDIDVNIHPVKTEIKFENEQVMWQILMAAVRDSVGRFSEVTSLDFDTEGKPDIPVYNPDGNHDVKAPRIDFNPSYNPFKTSYKNSALTSSTEKAEPASLSFGGIFPCETDDSTSPVKSSIPFGGGQKREALDDSGDNVAGNTPFPFVEGWGEAVSFDSLMQHQARYIVVSQPGGIMLVDQHRASMRLLYDDYMDKFNNHQAHTQKVLFPEIVQFPPSYATSLDDILSELRVLGFEITPLGGGNYSVEGIPSGLGGLDAVSLVSDLASEAFEQGLAAKEQVHSAIALALAKRAATPYGEILDEQTMRSLVTRLMGSTSPRYAPDGKKILVLLPNADIERMV